MTKYTACIFIDDRPMSITNIELLSDEDRDPLVTSEILTDLSSLGDRDKYYRGSFELLEGIGLTLQDVYSIDINDDNKTIAKGKIKLTHVHTERGADGHKVLISFSLKKDQE